MNNIFNLYLFSLLLPIIFIIIIPLYVNISLYIDINIKKRPIKNKNLIISFVSLKLFFMLLVILHLIIFQQVILLVGFLLPENFLSMWRLICMPSFSSSSSLGALCFSVTTPVFRIFFAFRSLCFRVGYRIFSVYKCSNPYTSIV